MTIQLTVVPRHIPAALGYTCSVELATVVSLLFSAGVYNSMATAIALASKQFQYCHRNWSVVGRNEHRIDLRQGPAFGGPMGSVASHFLRAGRASAARRRRQDHNYGCPGTSFDRLLSQGTPLLSPAWAGN